MVLGQSREAGALDRSRLKDRWRERVPQLSTQAFFFNPDPLYPTLHIGIRALGEMEGEGSRTVRRQ